MGIQGKKEGRKERKKKEKKLRERNIERKKERKKERKRENKKERKNQVNQVSAWGYLNNGHCSVCPLSWSTQLRSPWYHDITNEKLNNSQFMNNIIPLNSLINKLDTFNLR